MDQTEPPRDPAGPTHTVVPAGPTAVADLTRRRRTRTRLTVVIAEPGSDGAALVHDVTSWAPPQFDTELVVVRPDAADDPDGTIHAATAAHLDALAWSWEDLERPAGGRAAALDRATSVSAGDFLVVPRRGDALARLPLALGHLWVNGADALVVAPAPAEPAPDGECRTDRPTGAGRGPGLAGRRLAEALGVRSTGPVATAPVLAVLRRWVARFLLDDLGRAIDPVDEFADRVRLLELRLIEVVG